jgi:hypothetical protein
VKGQSISLFCRKLLYFAVPENFPISRFWARFGKPNEERKKQQF